jgi:hypothetical protein
MASGIFRKLRKTGLVKAVAGKKKSFGQLRKIAEAKKPTHFTNTKKYFEGIEQDARETGKLGWWD